MAPVLRFAVVGACLAALSCVSPIRTEHDFDPAADFGSYVTFAWISPDPLILPEPGRGNSIYVSPLEDARIRRAVDAELTRRGYRRMEVAEEADLVVSFTVGREQKVRADSTPTGSVYGGRYGYGGWYAGSTVRVYTYTEGTLALEFYDRRQRQAVWVGWASKRMSSSDDSAEVIQRAVSLILQEFPSRV